ncbi:50S ribosomal protein L25/general stress protein Ctc [Peribacillus kribbensis]|uniref:50S ribosomal protein L25/general stress protein Ctc n=1 Tax=Peribacillus kribbensis TaxID=356658 RepID=UPI0004026B2A|nr:50S ribosomal protein L25/general stress protein Ctc [Peribacillus kribbensis]
MSNMLSARERKESQNSFLTSVRQNGGIPAVVYGRNKESKSIVIDSKDLIKTIKEVGRNGIISLNVDGSPQNVMLTDYQTDSLKNTILHADFLYIDMSTEINAQVRVNLTGTPAGESEGGVLQQAIHDLSITAKPNDIPEAIEADVSPLGINETLYVGDIKKNYGNILINHEEDEVIASVLPPRQQVEPADEGEADGGDAAGEEPAAE